MKKIFFLSIMFCTLAACDDVSVDERFSKEPVTFTPQKNVLIEDFTGQNCLNCPNAADVTHSLQNLYGEEHVIAVAIHGGGLKLPLPETNPQQLATALGDAYNDHWGVQSWPNGMVDRTGLREYTSWSAEAVKRMQMSAAVEIQAARVDDNAAEIKADSVTMEVMLKGIENVEGKLQVWLVEDDITAMQRMPNGDVERNYLHQHVLRTSVTDPYGDAVTVAKGEEKSVKLGCVLASNWKRENLSVVAFVFNDSKGVLQVIKAKLF